MIIYLPVLLFALVIDRILGDPKTSLHPVALIGRFIGWWGVPGHYPGSIQRFAGIIGWFVTVLIFSTPFILVQLYASWYVYLVLAPFLLKVCFAWRSLEEHASAVSQAVSLSDSQKQASYLVSRDTSALNDEQVLSAAYESVAENLNDSIIAPLFWFLLFGLPGVAVYRAANTMDAMLGYPDERIRIGWFAARMDDLLSWIPARICGIVLMIRYLPTKRFRQAVSTLRSDRRKRPGFNGGIPMSLIAGGEGIRFEKPGRYQIGAPERTMREAGPGIIHSVRLATIIFCAIAGIALLLFTGMNNVYGI